MIAMNNELVNALIGGVIIGLATVIMMHFNGRIAGISGIINGAFKIVPGDWAWRIFFIFGLLTGGLLMKIANPESFNDKSGNSTLIIAVAGLLVGFGTIMGNGCTSGHGVCGISRLSKRSIVATIVFISAGVFTVTLKQWLTR
ncbi:MAG: hypothetical protein RJB66_859 [Pseudomonadota bacterium]|jgi:uncharacterized membrane protein YedE/YeeE